MKTNLPQLTTIGRGSGKTTAICEAAKAIGATVVVHSEQERKRIEEIHKVPCTTYGREIRGTTGPYLVDTHAVSMASMEYENTIDGLKEESEFRRRKNEQYILAISSLESALKVAEEALASNMSLVKDVCVPSNKIAIAVYEESHNARQIIRSIRDKK